MKNQKELIDYWKKSSGLDFEAAQDLLSSKKYAHCLFFAHLSMEKILKALYVKEKNEHPPITHNLLMLVKRIGLELDEAQVEHFAEINTFNIEARYPDVKFKFYQKCTAEFAETYMKIIEDLLKWLEGK